MDITEVDFSIRRYRARFCNELFFRNQLSDTQQRKLTFALHKQRYVFETSLDYYDLSENRSDHQCHLGHEQ
jgi:hypothetical protein